MNKVTKPVNLLLLACAAFLGSISSASAETRIAALQRQCPAATTALRLEHQAYEAHAVADDQAYKMFRDAARLYYRCSTTVSGDDRELALMDYAIDMNSSLRTNGEVIESAPQLDAVLNELAYSAKLTDVRNLALDLRRGVRSEYRSAYKTVNGSYPTDAAELPDPAQSRRAAIPEYVGPTVDVTPSP